MDKIMVKQSQKVKVQLNQEVSVSDDYLRLNNKPTINGVELSGDKDWSSLSLLSSKADKYKEINLGAADSGSFLLVLSGEKQAEKVRLSELTEGRVKTAESIPNDLQVGNYVFVLREGER